MRDFTESDFCFIMPVRFSFTLETGEGGGGEGGKDPEGGRERGRRKGGRREEGREIIAAEMQSTQ